MILYKELDVTGINQGIIAHGVNCQGKMASGVAKTIREKWPIVYDIYKKHGTGQDMLGLAHIICVNHQQELHVANCYTQLFYGYGGGRYADPAAIGEAIEAVAQYARAHDNLPIFMPRIGCGLGGLDWQTDVLPVLNRVAALYPTIDIVVCDLPSEDTSNGLITY